MDSSIEIEAVTTALGNPMTERDATLAVFNAICGLAEKLTGERLTVAVRCEDGEVRHFTGNGCSWSPNLAPVA